MPRLCPNLFRKAHKIHPLLPLLLTATRDLESAKNELRWITQHFSTNQKNEIFSACLKRSKHYPLQYILGSQPFDKLEILCKPGVLIPRWETEEWTIKLGNLINQSNQSNHLTIVDLCTGSGCIPLLLSTFISHSNIWAVDISSKATSLLNQNLRHNAEILDLANSNNCFSTIKANILSQSLPIQISNVDLITANPPYIPASSFNSSVEKSVKLFEPKLALIGNLFFYTAIFNHATTLNSKALICEVGNQSQINHLIDLAIQQNIHTPPHEHWYHGSMKDSNGNPRIVVLWKSSWSFLNLICN